MSYDHYTPPEPTRSQLEQQVEELEAEVAEAKEQRLTFTALHDAVDELSLDKQDMAHRLLGDLHLYAVRGEWAETPTDTAQAMMLAARREVEQLRAELAECESRATDLICEARGELKQRTSQLAECEASRGRLQVALLDERRADLFRAEQTKELYPILTADIDPFEEVFKDVLADMKEVVDG